MKFKSTSQSAPSPIDTKKYLSICILTLSLFTIASLFFAPLDEGTTGIPDNGLILEGNDYYTGYPLYYFKRMSYMGEAYWRTEWRLEYLVLDLALTATVSFALYGIIIRKNKK